MTSKVQCQFLNLPWTLKMFTQEILRKLVQIFKVSDFFLLIFLLKLSSWI